MKKKLKSSMLYLGREHAYHFKLLKKSIFNSCFVESHNWFFFCQDEDISSRINKILDK